MRTDAQEGKPEAIEHRLQGKYLTFSLDDEEYGVDILRVTEIIGLMKIRPIPGSAMELKGIINLRGRVIPVLDLRLRFGMCEAEHTERTCIIIVELSVGGRQVNLGMIVDTVNEVAEFKEEQIEPAPQHAVGINTRNILGIAKRSSGAVVLLLDIGQALGSDSSLFEMGTSCGSGF